MPPDAAPPSRPGAPTSSRKAVRAGVLAALSNPAAVAPAAAETPPVVVEEQPAAMEAQPEAAVAVPVQHPPARGFGASLRAAGRRGLLLARPLAAPFLHRLQMRMRTAVNESDVAARVAGIEQALAGLSERFDAEITAARREVGGVAASLAERSDAARREVWEFAANNARRFDAIGRGVAEVAASLAERSDAARREVGEAAASLTERSDAVRREVAGVGEVAAANARRLDAARQEIGSLQQQLAAARHELALAQAAQAGVSARVDQLTRSAQRAAIPVGQDFAVRTPDGYLLVPSEDLPFLVFLFESGAPEPGTRRVLERLLRPGSTFLDVGANVGTMTLFAARAVGRAGRVYAVEPTPRLAALLQRSLAMNGVSGRVEVAACAAGEASGEAVLHLQEIMSHNSLFSSGEADADQTMTVPMRPVDEVVPPGTALDVAKIDVEGAELRVLRGMRRVLEESPALSVVLELNPPQLPRIGTTLEAWLDEVEAPGFASYVINEETGTCRPARATPLADLESANLLLLRPGAAARHPGLIEA